MFIKKVRNWVKCKSNFIKKSQTNAYGLLFLHHSRISSWEDKRLANSCSTESLAGAWEEGKDCILHLNSGGGAGAPWRLDSWTVSVLTCSWWRTLSSVWAELRLRQWIHPRSSSRRDNGWNSNFSKSLSWGNSSCLIRSSAVTYRKEPISLRY